MAAPPRQKRLNIEDFPGAPSWFEKFVGVLNEFFSDVQTALAGQLTRGENIRGTSREVAIDMPASGTPFPFRVKHGLAVSPTAVLLGRVQALSPGDVLASAVTILWELGLPGEIRLTNVSGLNAGKQYRLTLLVEG